MQPTNYYNYVFLDLRKPGKYDYDIELCFLYEPFYIGKGHGNRYKNHIYDKKQSYKLKLINKLLRNYTIDEISIIFNKNVTDEISKENEIRLIKKIGRYNLNEGPLTNITEGGEGRSSDEMTIWNNEHWSDPKNREHLSKMVKEKQWSGEKGRKRKEKIKYRDSWCKTYLINYPNGDDVIIKNMAKFCRENGFKLDLVRSWVDRGIIQKKSKKDNSFLNHNKNKIKGFCFTEIK